MTKSHRPAAEDVDLSTLGRALWQAKGWIFGLTIGAGLISFVALSMVRPLFTSEARILIQNDELAFTPPTADEGRDPRLIPLDEQAVESQVQVMTSRDLAVDVVKALDLTNNPDFAKDEGLSFVTRILNAIGPRASPKSEEEKAANTFADNLDVFRLATSSVIAIKYTSGDLPLAAKIANQLAHAYVEWQRNTKLEQTNDATAWLRDQIEVLRKKTAEAEAAAEQFHSSERLYAGSNNVTLNDQQLSEINGQLILAEAQRSKAEARARVIQKMIDDGGDIDATPEVLKSELVGRLIEQRVQVQRELAQLSATLLPSHPRIKQLNSELADVREQIRDEAAKNVKGLKNEAEVASARETSLRNSLNDTKARDSGQGDAEIKLRALEREAKADRDLLELFLARYRDASARHDMGAVPAQAAIVSRAHASILPSFPQRGPLSLLIMVATVLVALASLVARELLGAPASAAPQATTAATVVPAIAAATQAAWNPGGAKDTTPTQAPPNAASMSASEPPKAEIKTAAGPANPTPNEQSTASGLLDRLRQGLAAAQSEPMRAQTAKTGQTISPLGANDLRHYLNQHIAQATRTRVEEPKVTLAAPKVGNVKIGPVLKSLEGVLNHIFAAAKDGAPRAVLVSGATPQIDATQEAIRIARALVASREQVLLIDLTRGASAVSGPLGLPRAPGFTDLAAGRAGFDDVIRVDIESALQVIAAGNPAVNPKGEEIDRFMRVFEALTEAYDFVVLHADRDTVKKLTPALKFELPVTVVVLPQGTSASAKAADLGDFAALDCPVVVYEQTGKEGRSGLLGRVAAI